MCITERRQKNEWYDVCLSRKAEYRRQNKRVYKLEAELISMPVSLHGI